MNVGGSRSNDWIFIAINDHETSEYRLVPADDPTAEPKIVAPRETGLEYDLEEGGDVFFILTNADGAKDFKIVTAPAADPRRENWTELVPHEPGRLILSILSLQGFPGPAGAQGRAAAHRRARPRDRRGAYRSPSTRKRFRSGCRAPTNTTPKSMRFSYSSMTTPAQLFDYDMRTRERTLAEDPGSARPATIRTTMSRAA